MKKISVIFAAACLMTACWSGAALAWGSASHAYINDRIGSTGVALNGQEMYGGMASDVFNFSFAHPDWMTYLYTKTHTDFMGIRDIAGTPGAKALGYGFASHNGVWGADLTAHNNSLTFGQGSGYVTAKAYDVKNYLANDPALTALNLPEEALLEICHTMVEYGVDILVKRLDPHIGKKVSAAAIFRSREFPALLNRAYAGDLVKEFGISKREAADFIIGTESNFRHIILQYGMDLNNNETATVQIFAGQLNSFAATFLKKYGVILPEGVDFTPLATLGIQQAMRICADDFAAELAETTKFTHEQLTLHGVTD